MERSGVSKIVNSGNFAEIHNLLNQGRDMLFTLWNLFHNVVVTPRGAGRKPDKPDTIKKGACLSLSNTLKKGGVQQLSHYKKTYVDRRVSQLKKRHPAQLRPGVFASWGWLRIALRFRSLLSR